ncbi:hypothetical protein DLM78_09110 [Leptospira stimsonii]|uniref:Uncharacterized protein n=1 Tax=Leptospira stimsonii TaxID=2202203 RepID=A0A8B3CRB9_9LEPT|nr:hypothetical protein DLM78_09110 [Leptospira stimsonii]
MSFGILLDFQKRYGFLRLRKIEWRILEDCIFFQDEPRTPEVRSYQKSKGNLRKTKIKNLF